MQNNLEYHCGIVNIVDIDVKDLQQAHSYIQWRREREKAIKSKNTQTNLNNVI